MADHPRVRQIGWFVALWVGGVAAVTIVGLVIRLFLAP
ncbi:DUF2474 family protein [Devosia sp. PTR5]|uniref:DUF2474 family protein n=1 Tax=Devosia oryzisoli TaxID=2774138 RepID=A0A927FTP9_9HYPH|nr:DUF2474 family protein [Devosia oryzisoli]MBD8064979.1 DUF2474 family protein [Devosia oryzisoli]